MKPLRICGKVLLILLAVLLVLLLLLQVGVTVMYWDYFSNAEPKFLIPGLTSAFVPQGFDYVEEEGCYLISGYMSDHSASRVYVRYENGDTHFVELKNADGSDYSRHAGGVCHNGEFVYIAGKKGVEVFRLADFLQGSVAVNVGKIQADYNIAYCTFYNGYLLAGNFYYPEAYETPKEHRLTTPAGDANTALITVYQADETEDLGIDPTPVAAISTRGKVQGICFTSENEIVLSTSYSVPSSVLYRYRIDTERTASIQVLDTQVPLLYLDSENLMDTVKLPPMAEELVYRDGRVYVMCESACNKYIFGKLIRGHQVFAYEFES